MSFQKIDSIDIKINFISILQVYYTYITMLTRNRAKLLNIEVANVIPLPEKKRRFSEKQNQRDQPHIQKPTKLYTNVNNLYINVNDNPRMVSFAENIEYAPLYEVNIDFDEAHDAWVANKIKQKNGCYKYRKHPKKSKKE